MQHGCEGASLLVKSLMSGKRGLGLHQAHMDGKGFRLPSPCSHCCHIIVGNLGQRVSLPFIY